MAYISVFDYLNPSAYLQDVWKANKKNAREGSVRTVAKEIGLSAHGPLHQMLIGKRKISKNLVPKLAQFFKLSDDETLYLDFLVKLSHAKDSKAVDFYTSMMKRVVPKKSNTFKQIVDFSFQKSPINFFILELASLVKLPNDWKVIQKHLVRSYNEKEIKDSIKILIESNKIVVEGKYLVRKDTDNFTSIPDTLNLASRNCHKEFCSIASEALDSQPLEDREFNTYTLNIDVEKLPEIKKYLRKVIANFSAKFEENGKNANATYNLNLQLFKIANKE